MPAEARNALGLPSQTHWRVFGVPRLGVAVIVGPRQGARESLDFLLRSQPPSPEPR